MCPPRACLKTALTRPNGASGFCSRLAAMASPAAAPRSYTVHCNDQAVRRRSGAPTPCLIADAILNILPGRPAGTRAPRDCPFERLALHKRVALATTDMLRIAMNRPKTIVLRTGIKAESTPEAAVRPAGGEKYAAGKAAQMDSAPAVARVFKKFWLYVRMTNTEHFACRTIVLALEPIR